MRGCLRRKGKMIAISIHAPHGGSDADMQNALAILEVFQSTLPVGGATTSEECYRFCYNISIHAPRGGSDEGHRKNLLSV